MKRSHFKTAGLALLALLSLSTYAQTPASQAPKAVVITGNRFSYPLIEKWIDEYNKVNPSVQIIIESRGSTDPLKYDILAEVYEPEEALKKSREFIYVARYAVLPVANSRSAFSKVYSERGLTTSLIKQLFFHDMFADKDKQQTIREPYTVYTRLQKAGVPITFAHYFGYEQKDLAGIAIAGADAHLLKALLRDSTGVTYLPLPLVYEETTGKPVEGLTVLPVDLNGNGKLSESEKIYGNLENLATSLELAEPGSLKNIPIEYLHLSVDKEKGSADAIDFLKWVNENGQNYLHQFGYLKPEAKRFEKGKFMAFASSKGR